MLRTSLDRRPSRRTAATVAAAAIGVVGLIPLAAAPASADGSPTGLALAPLTSVDGVKPGGSFQVPGTFANKGATDLDKVYLSYSVTRGLAHQELPSNCTRYETTAYDENPSHSVAVCEFDQTLKAGAVYAPEKNLSLNVLGHALYDTLRVTVATYNSEPSDGTRETVRGTGPAVKLTELPSTTPVRDGDVNHPDWDSVSLTVTADNTADFQVADTLLKGRVGDTVSLDAKFTNAGPGWVLSALGDPVAQVLIKMPAGTTVTKASGACSKVATGSYSCGLANSWIEEKGSVTYQFKLRIGKAVPGAEGSVALGAEDRPYDKNKKNDSAAIRLDVDGADGSTGGSGSTGGGGSTSGGGSTGGSGSTSGTGGSGGTSTGGSGSTGGSAATGSSGSSTTGGDLANTGSGSALPLAGAAAAALVAGAGAVLVVRRRAARG
ncbi:hypothetical protein [Streptomyces sp. NPDC058751]|uniref:hypothetical protein n=1 Tax=Streptomyces sp. NPDC058751 TaxID=3346623 RepID=UPI0036B7258D